MSFRVRFELPNFVVNLLHVALASGCGDDLSRDRFEPLESFLGHLLGEDGDAVTA